MALPLSVGLALLVSACGSDAEPVAAPSADESTEKLVQAVVKYLDAQNKRKDFEGDELARPALEKAIAAVQEARKAQPAAVAAAEATVEKEAPAIEARPSAVRSTGGGLQEDAVKKRASEERAAAAGGATDVGITKNSIKTGTVMMHGMALARLTTAPQIAGQRAALAAVNDRGGVLACNQVRQILDSSGSKMVKKVDVPITETSMAAYVLGMRAADPDHIVHYVINPATVVKFIVESGQQGYYPRQGISGNHMASEVLGSLYGNLPVGRYWTNTTYKLWGAEFMAVMNKYARSNLGSFHHIVQSGYVGVNMFAQAAKQVGPNLTRERLMAALGNGAVWSTDSSLDQKFSYTAAERGGTYAKQSWNRDMGQGREFMYQYNGSNTVSNPDGSPSGWRPDPTRFAIHTDR